MADFKKKGGGGLLTYLIKKESQRLLSYELDFEHSKVAFYKYVIIKVQSEAVENSPLTVYWVPFRRFVLRRCLVHNLLERIIRNPKLNCQ